MSMKSIEDLEKAFDRGLDAWESAIAEKRAMQMGQKCVREIKRNTPHITGNLKRRWRSRTEQQKGDIKIILENDAEYAPHVNNGHRIVRGGKTVGYKEGRHMLETGIAAYQDNYMRDDLQGMADDLGKAMRG